MRVVGSGIPLADASVAPSWSRHAALCKTHPLRGLARL